MGLLILFLQLLVIAVGDMPVGRLEQSRVYRPIPESHTWQCLAIAWHGDA